jgi:Gram-negative bacterial TonB protein C-terminal
VRAARSPLPRGAVITSYPAEAARSHVSARIAAVLTIDASGKVVAEDTRLVPDDPLFHSAVLEALDGAEFTPAEIDGNPMSYWLILEFVFYIDPAQSAAAGPR